MDQVAEPNRRHFGTRAMPSPFTGDITVNALIWWNKFHSFCERNDIPVAQRVNEFTLLITDSCENWFAMLPIAQKDTYEHLRDAFLGEYANPNVNIAERELFYARKQQHGETAINFIECMIKLGNKLQLHADEVLRTTIRGLLPDLHMYILDKNVANISELKHKVQLREMMHTFIDTQSTANRVQFATSKLDNNDVLQTSIDKLTSALDKLHLTTVNNGQQHSRARSPSPYYTQNTQTNTLQPTNQQFQRPPFCSKCRCMGHFADQCTQQSNFIFAQTQPNFSYRGNSYNRFSQNLGGRSNYFRGNNYQNYGYENYAQRERNYYNNNRNNQHYDTNNRNNYNNSYSNLN
jgi:hypothetical protein